MGYVHSLRIGQNQYLVEPFLYAAASGTGDAYTVSLSEYTILPGTILFITIPANSSASATLSVNGSDPGIIYYQDATIAPGQLRAGLTYAFTYANDKWNVVSTISSGTTVTIDTNGGLEIGTNGLRIKNNGIVTAMILDSSVTNDKLQNNSITIAGNEVVLGGSISLADLGLNTVLHFKGIARNSTLADGSMLDPFSTAADPPTYTGQSGDVVIDMTQESEYVWLENSGWLLLGSNDSFKIIQTAVSDPSASGATNAFIDSISQNTNGDITVTKKYVSSWQFPRKIYTALGTASTTVEVNGDSENATAVGIGIDGILPVAHGGTGADENAWALGGIVYGAQAGNVKSYAAVSGSAYQILTSGGSGVPVWATAALLESVVNTTLNAQNYTTLELGNNKSITDATYGHSEGRLILFSAGTDAHFLYGASTNTAYTHTLPNADGIILQKADVNAVGSNTEPIYIAADGTATALTYTPNRLYYSDAAVTGETYAIHFLPSNHYADADAIGIGTTTWPSGNTDALYVNGNSSFNGIVKIVDTTDITGSANGSLVVSGGATIAKKLVVNDDVTFNDLLVVVDTTTLTSNVGIGGAPDTAVSDNHILSIYGATLIKSGNTDVAHLDIDATYSTLIFIPETTATGTIGTTTNRWASIYASDLLSVASSDSSILLEIDSGSSSNASTAAITLTSTAPAIIFDTSTTNAADWTIINNVGVFSISDGVSSEIIGNTYGFRLGGRLYINESSALTQNSDLDLYVNGTTELLGNVGIGAAPIQDFALYVDDDVKVKGNILPQADNTYNLGLKDSTSYRWKGLYLSDELDLSDTTTTAGVVLEATGALTLSAATPIITLETTTSNADSWVLQNASGVMTLSNGSYTLKGNSYGFEIDDYLYVSAAVPSSNPYNFYVNGTSFFNDEVTFKAATSSAISSALNWTGGDDSASIYFKVASTNAGRLMLNVDGTGDNCLIGLAYGGSESIYVDTYNYTMYPGITNYGSLGTSNKRWGALYIGTADTYGDAYTPIYWYNGKPVAVNIVQKINWSMQSTHKSCKISTSSGAGIFATASIVMQIVVTSGESNLNAPLTWKSNTDWIAINTATAVSGDVSGYVLVVRGVEMADSNFTYTRATSEV